MDLAILVTLRKCLIVKHLRRAGGAPRKSLIVNGLRTKRNFRRIYALAGCVPLSHDGVEKTLRLLSCIDFPEPPVNVLCGRAAKLFRCAEEFAVKVARNSRFVRTENAFARRDNKLDLIWADVLDFHNFVFFGLVSEPFPNSDDRRGDSFDSADCLPVFVSVGDTGDHQEIVVPLVHDGSPVVLLDVFGETIRAHASLHFSSRAAIDNQQNTRSRMKCWRRP
jgi:hypothetical protein